MKFGGPLGLHRFLLRAGFSLTTIFAWVALFQFHLSITHAIAPAVVKTAFLYLLAQCITALLTPFSARMVRNGVRRGMVFGIVAASGAFALLGAAFSGSLGSYVMYGTTAFAMLLGAYRALYWVPYSIEKAAEPKATSFDALLTDFLIAGMPLAAGLYIGSSSLALVWFLFCASCIVLASIMPLINVRERYDRFSWRYAEAFGNLVEPRFHGIVLTSLFDGAQGAALYFIWPLLAFMLVGNSYIALGAVATLSLLIAIPARIFSHSFSDMWNLRSSSAVPVIIIGSVWLMRLAVATPIGIVFVDAFAALIPGRRHLSMISMLDHASDHGSYIDEFTALKEVALAIGRILMVCLFSALALVMPLASAVALTFIIAALLAMTSIWRDRQLKVAEY